MRSAVGRKIGLSHLTRFPDVRKGTHQDQRIRPLDITAEEQEALVEFLRTLTASNVDALVADARSIEIGDRDNTGY